MLKTTGKEYFYQVSGLMAPRFMVDKNLTENIEFFVDYTSKNASTIEQLAEDGRLDILKVQLEVLYEILCSIYAHWLEMEAARILRMIEVTEKELVMKLTIPFVANMRTLAIDIQMAQTKGFETSYRHRDEIERLSDEMSTIKVVLTLMKSSEFEKACDLALGMSELLNCDDAAELMSCIVSKDGGRAEELAKNIIDFYQKRIEEVVDTAAKTGVQKKILILDDMPEDLDALSYMLKGKYHVFAFTEPKEALHFIETKQQPDAFILDICMPEMDGLAMAKKIRENIKFANTPILFLTGNSARDIIMKAALYRPKAFIVKPANKAIIVSKLSSCLK